MRIRYGIIALAIICNACTREPVLVVDDAALADESRGENWLAFGRTYSEQRFSPLEQINRSNVTGLGIDWYLDLPADRGLVSTPLVVDGVMYFVGSMNRVRAVDAATGELLWEYDPEVALYGADNRMRIGWEHNRGVAFWKGKVFAATWDGRLKGIDAATGREIWSAMTVDPDSALYITGAPKVFKGKVLIGNGGTEWAANRGYVTAYDAETGEQLWRFYIVPGNPANGFESEAMRMAAETWTGEWWRYGGGGNAWHGFTYDAELDTLYIGTGNGSPWNRKIRSPDGGDNLFLCSIVALDPDTGEYRWHYQTTPGESWDYNSNMDIVLADLEIAGREVKALMHAPKNGFFYVIDRQTGKLISAEPYTVTSWAKSIDLETGRPVEVAGARYEDGEATVAPGPVGGHNWHAMSYNPLTGLAYIPTIHGSAIYSDEILDLDTWRSPYFRYDAGVRTAPGPNPRADGVTSSLQAWDPVRQQRVWEIPMSGIWNPGTLTTAGYLVFQGRADGHLFAYDAATGKVLWSVYLGNGISAPPVTYAVDGRQYLALLVGWGGGTAGLGGAAAAAHGWAYGVHPRRLVALSLQGNTVLPPSPPPGLPTPLPLPDFGVDQELADQGRLEFEDTCSRCHGPGVIAAGMAPDLRASAAVRSAALFEDIVRNGSRAENGMPRYDHLSDEQLLTLRHYIRQRAESALQDLQPVSPVPDD
jgi:quinohemoprotein ethanol dehydrogenase